MNTLEVIGGVALVLVALVLFAEFWATARLYREAKRGRKS
jgi:nitrogen fixation-related uncharacterized protein